MGKKVERIKFTKEEKIRIMEKTGCRCGHCGLKLELPEATIDHMIPLNKGGLNDEYNMVMLCKKCNDSKSNYLYDTLNYYPYILDEYRENFKKYQSFVIMSSYEKSLFGIEMSEYKGYSFEHKRLLYQMLKRHASQKNIDKAMKRLGIKFILMRAYEGDAKEIMAMIENNMNDKNVIFNECYYKNEYMVLDDIRRGEIYILRQVTNNKIHGAFGFKKINEDTFNIPQLQTITMNTNFRPKYAMTTAVTDYFAEDCFNEIMKDTMSNMVQTMSIPIYFNILGPSFKSYDKCIVVPYEIDGVTVNVEFPTIGYIKDLTYGYAEYAAKKSHCDMSEDELDILTDIILHWRKIKDIDREANEEQKALLEKYPEIREIFIPESCPLYGVGFIDEEKEEDECIAYAIKTQ